MPLALHTDRIILPLHMEQEHHVAFSRLVAGPEAQVGLLCLDNRTGLLSSEETKMSARLSFFQVNVASQQVSHSQRPWHHTTNEAQLSYDEQWQTWAFYHSTDRAEVSYVLLAPEQEEWLQTLIHVDAPGNAFFARHLLVAAHPQAYHLFYYAGAVNEVAEPDLYRVIWDLEAWRRYRIPRQNRGRIGFPDEGRGYLWRNAGGNETRYFLFLLGRCLDHQAPIFQPRVGPGAWNWSMRLVDLDEHVIRSLGLTDASLRFFNPDAPARDLKDRLAVQMVVGDGPPREAEHDLTCVAALVLTERHPGPPPQGEQDEGFPVAQKQQMPQQLGGLFCFDGQGILLGASQSRLGEMLSFCSRGRSVIGADLLQGQGRFWSWSPFSNDPLQVWKPLDAGLLRATVVAHALHPTQFWLVEEYAHTVKVSLYTWQEAEGGTELATTWLEQVTLPSPLLSLHPGEDRSAIVLALGDALLLVGKDQQGRFGLYQIG